MRPFTVVLVLLASMAQLSAQNFEGFLFRGHLYELAVDEAALRKAPSWDPSSAPNPPLAAAGALHAATNFIAQVSKGDGWFFDSSG